MNKKEIEEIVNEVLEIVYEEIDIVAEQGGEIEWLNDYIPDSIKEWKKRKFKVKSEKN